MRKVKGRWSQGGKSILFNPNTLIFSFARNSKHIDLVACFVQSYKEIVFACKPNLARTQMNHKKWRSFQLQHLCLCMVSIQGSLFVYGCRMWLSGFDNSPIFAYRQNELTSFAYNAYKDTRECMADIYIVLYR